MSYKKLIKEDSTILSKSGIYQYYYNKYYNLFMNAYKWEGIDDKQIDYVMRRFWSDGKVAAFKIKHTESEENPQGMICFTPYAPISFDLYDYPIDVTLVNTKGVPFIPNKPMKVDKDVVIGYCQRNKKSVFAMVDFYIKKIVDIEMTIRTNLKAQKTPFLLAVTPESEARVKSMWESIDTDNPMLYVGVDDAKGIVALNTGATYNIDKLYNYKIAIENELKEYLGINNIGVTEKKEHLIGDEVEANDEVVQNSADCFFDVLNEFTKRVNDVLGYNLTVSINKAEQYEDNSKEEKEDVEE